MTCPSCHHLPSGRFNAAGMQCYCDCHDIADAAPLLLGAAIEALNLPLRETLPLAGGIYVHCLLSDAVALATGKPASSLAERQAAIANRPVPFPFKVGAPS